MRLAALAGALLSAVLSSGCLVVSLHPLYGDDAIEFDEALIGEWQSAEDKADLRVERGQWRSYRISYTEDGSTECFSAFLTRVGAVRLLDLSPCRVPEATSLLAAMHLAARVQLLGDSLALSVLDYDWFRAEVEHGRLAALAPAVGEDGNVVLSATTAALRGWLAAHTASRFDDPVRFTRRQVRPAP